MNLVSFVLFVVFVALGAWVVVDRIALHKELAERRRNTLRLVYRHEREKGYQDVA